MIEPFCHYWEVEDEYGVTFAHLVEGEAEEQGYIPLYLHPIPVSLNLKQCCGSVGRN